MCMCKAESVGKVFFACITVCVHVGGGGGVEWWGMVGRGEPITNYEQG